MKTNDNRVYLSHQEATIIHELLEIFIAKSNNVDALVTDGATAVTMAMAKALAERTLEKMKERLCRG